MTTTTADLAKEAFLLYDQLVDMRRNVVHLVDLPGVTAFIAQFNDKTSEIRTVVAADNTIHKTLTFLRPIDPDTSGSEYPTAIIDGKRGQFMVASGVLMNALKNFMRLTMSDEDRVRFDLDSLLRDR